LICLINEALKKWEVILSGNRDFNQIVKDNHQKIFGLFMKMVGRHDQADELTQRTFVTVYKKLDTFRGESSLDTWIYRIAVNIGKNYLNKKRVKDFVGLDKIKELIYESSSNINEDSKNYLQQAIQKLPPKQTMVVLLRSFQGLPYKKIGAILDISENSAKVNFSHALKNLRKKLNQMGVDYEQL